MSKYFKLLVFFTILSSAAFSQSKPINVYRSAPSVTVNDAYLHAYLGFTLPVVSDTAHGMNSSLDSLGQLIYVKANGGVYKRDSVPTGGHVWTVIGSSSGSPGAWGSITGLITDQTDLYDALQARQLALGYVPIAPADTAHMLSDYLRKAVAQATYYPLSTNPSGFLTANGLPNVVNALQVINAGGADSWASGTYAARPAAGTPRRFYFATDSAKIYFDNGSVWLTAAGGGTGGSGGTIPWGAITGTLSSQTDLQNALNLNLKIASNLSDLNNVTTARSNLGLGNVDNTPDASKPVSTAQATAIAGKVDNYTSTAKFLGSGTYAGKPVATTGKGFWYATDSSFMLYSNGTSWIKITDPAGLVYNVYVRNRGTGTGLGTAVAADSTIYLKSIKAGTNISLGGTDTNTILINGPDTFNIKLRIDTLAAMLTPVPYINDSAGLAGTDSLAYYDSVTKTFHIKGIDTTWGMSKIVTQQVLHLGVDSFKVASRGRLQSLSDSLKAGIATGTIDLSGTALSSVSLFAPAIIDDTYKTVQVSPSIGGGYTYGYLEEAAYNLQTGYIGIVGVSSAGHPYNFSGGAVAGNSGHAGGFYNSYIFGFSAVPLYDNSGGTIGTYGGYTSALSGQAGKITNAVDFSALEFNAVNRTTLDTLRPSNHMAYYSQPLVKAVHNYGLYLQGIDSNWIAGKTWIGGGGTTVPTDNGAALQVIGKISTSIRIAYPYDTVHNKYAGFAPDGTLVILPSPVSGGGISDSGFAVLRGTLINSPIAKVIDGSGHRFIVWDTTHFNPSAIVTQAWRQALADSLVALLAQKAPSVSPAFTGTTSVTLLTGATTSTPTLTIGSGVPATGGASVGFTAHDAISGSFFITTGTGVGTAGGEIAQITLPTAQSSAAYKVFVQATSSAAAVFNTFVTVGSSTVFHIGLPASISMLPATIYSFNYFIIQ